MSDTVTWLHLSDIHIRKEDSTGLGLMMEHLEELADQLHPNFIVVTGDFRHHDFCPDFEAARDFLNQVSEILRVEKTDFYLVPGNHDAIKPKDGEEPGDYGRGERLKNILKNSKTAAAVPMEDVDYLKKAFGEYRDFVRAFYDGALSDDDPRINDPTGVMCLAREEDRLNLILVNTALVSNGKRDHKELLDLEALAQLRITNGFPSIVLAHHPTKYLSEKQSENIPDLLKTKIHACAYLCGDVHRDEGEWISSNIIDPRIPCITCGKSVCDDQDSWSKTCIIGYTWNRKKGTTEVRVYEYEDARKDKRYEAGFYDKGAYYHERKPLKFRMAETLNDRVRKKVEVCDGV